MALATRQHALDLATGPVPDPTEAEIESTAAQLDPFVKVYVAYLAKTAGSFVPKQNDLGDLHCFIYHQGNRKMLTGEKKWIDLVNEAGLGSLVVDSKTL